MTDGPTLTLKMLDAAIAKMKEPVKWAPVSYSSLDWLALRLQSDCKAGLADGSLKQEDLVPWTKRKLAELMGGPQ